jgi:hypothetical protein
MTSQYDRTVADTDSWIEIGIPASGLSVSEKLAILAATSSA